MNKKIKLCEQKFLVQKFFVSKIIILFLAIPFFWQTLFCAQSTSIDQSVTAKVFDRATGNLYLGLSSSSASTAAILMLPRYSGSGSILQNTIVPSDDSYINSAPIEFLTLSTKACCTKPVIITVAQSEDGPGQQTSVLGYSCDFATNNKSSSSEALNDANGDQTAGIISIAASKTNAYALVKANGKSNFGAIGSGLAAITVTNNIETGGSLILTQTNAQLPLGQKISKHINESTSELKIARDAIFTVSSGLLHWDPKLARLYVGISQITTATTAGARSIIVASSQDSGLVDFYNLAPDSAFLPDDITHIVGAISSDTKQLTIGVKNLKTMRTSTGKNYLIVNGANAQASQITPLYTDVTPGNTIFALPLVDNIQTATIHGTLANYLDPSFSTQAVLPSQLLRSTDMQTMVGAGPLPILYDQAISDIVVVGDAVFISINLEQDTNTEPGIFYSQAMFDEYGRIYRWTPWSKRAFPFYVIDNGQVDFLDVDAANGKIWASKNWIVDSNTTSTVYLTAWESYSQTKNPTDLASTLNKDFKCGCFCHLDLDMSTMGLGKSSPGRYALFGGLEIVAIARISSSTAIGDPYDYDPATGVQYSQYVSSDFTLPENYILTKMPPQSGCVKVLEYSRSALTANSTQGYIFAGTQAGLYVFTASSNQGFVSDSNVDYINAAPFSTGYWHKVNAIQGAVLDIISSGNALYVLTFETSPATPIKNILYKINFANDTTTMFDQSNIKTIAQTAITATGSDLSKAKMFYASTVMTTTLGNNFYEQVVLATNNGLYRTNCFTGLGACNANNQTDAAWQPIDSQDTSVYTDIFSVDNTNYNYLSTFSCNAYQTVWPLQVADKGNCLIFGNNNIRQLNGSYSSIMPTFDPENFNAQSFDCSECSNKNFNCTDLSIENNFNPLYPTSYFWSDGARRFFIMKKSLYQSSTNKLYVFPYDIQEWMVTDPKTQVLTDRNLMATKYFYWLGPIGASGIVLAGTDSGVVALE